MKCQDCGYDNPSGVFRCQKCGNSLIPSIPRDSYIEPRKPAKHRKAGKWLLIGLPAAGLVIGLLVISIGLANSIFGLSNQNTAVMESADEAAADAGSAITENYYDTDDPGQYIAEQVMTLPESEIRIGFPEYVDWREDYFSGDSDYSWSFDLANSDDLVLNFYSYTAVYPFSKSEEEEYFREGQNYLRLEGTDDQYFYTTENDDRITATIVDRNAGRNYVIEIVSASPDDNPSRREQALKRANRIMNAEILDHSSMAAAQKEEAAGNAPSAKPASGNN